MDCNCKWTEIIIAAVILVFTFVDFYSKWIILIAALALLLHASTCKNCGHCIPNKDMGSTSAKKSTRKKR